MKKYTCFIFFLTFIVLSSASVFANGEETTFTIDKIALKYQGESSYREYDIANVSWILNPLYESAEYDPSFVATLTDEANNLPSGVITEIKLYVINSESNSYWLKNDGTDAGSIEAAYNWLGAPVDLSTIKRKKVTCKFFTTVVGEEEQTGTMTSSTPTEENL